MFIGSEVARSSQIASANALAALHCTLIKSSGGEKGAKELREEPAYTMASKESAAAGFINVSREITGMHKLLFQITVILYTCSLSAF